ncbi:MAG: 4-hydroxy-tetrahydrodipicolinate reductase [Elusimicrobia bacterium]|nr:4-hydroxy-tetrahydrodipicolinate reductase [Elusimicrobiota bacterium]
MSAPAPLRLAVCGASGRTGARVAALAAQDARFRLVARVNRAGAAAFERRPPACDAVVDFTAPAAAVRFARACARAHVAFVTGTTGLSPAQDAALTAAAGRIPVFRAPNFSRGVAVLALLAEEAARRLAGWDAALVETHHAGKRDAPSGTALRLARAAREGGANASIFSLRVGGVIGDHALTFAGRDERVELVHRAESRDLFARGALDAALWTAGRAPGLYGMNDLLERP